MKISKLTSICLENHSAVTGWQEVFFLYIRRRCNRSFDYQPLVGEMSSRCSLKRVDEDSLFLLQWEAVRSEKEREKIKTREGGEEREGMPVVPHRPPQSPFYFSSLSLLRTRPHNLEACLGTG